MRTHDQVDDGGGGDIGSGILRLNVEEDNDGCADDIEALASRAHELSRFDMSNFCISPGDDDFEGDYDSITTTNEHEFPHDISGMDSPSDSPGDDDFALAERTSNIISSYRDYLSEMEGVSAKNALLADELQSLRGSLGVQKVSRGNRSVDRARSSDCERTRKMGGIEFHEEQRSIKYTLPLLHSRQLKKRLWGAVLGVAVIGSVAFAAAYTKESSHAKSIPDWDSEMAQAKVEEDEYRDAMNQEAATRTSWTPKTQGSSEEGSGGRGQSDEPPHDDSAMLIIQGMLAHPDEVEVKQVKSSPDSAVVAKKGSKSQKDGSFSKSGKSSSTSKSGKSILSYDITKETKPGKHSSESPAKQSSKSGKDSKTSEMTTPTPLPDVVKEARNVQLHVESAGILYQAISSKYNPLFFDRSKGWEGTTFTDVAYFCDQHYPRSQNGHPGVPCPYETYCPEGPNSIPFGGYRAGTSYAPIIEMSEHWLGWVQLSEGHPCVAYNDLNPAPTKEQTGSIMCCKDITR